MLKLVNWLYGLLCRLVQKRNWSNSQLFGQLGYILILVGIISSDMVSCPSFGQTLPNLPLQANHPVQIFNPSFEGWPQRDYPPLGWRVCSWVSTPDTQPAWSGNSQTPTDGKSYLSMVCRNQTEIFPTGSYESVVQLLNAKDYIPAVPLDRSALRKDSTYCFFIDLCFPGPNAGSGPDLFPALLRVWATSGYSGCNTEELLWTSPVIDHQQWRTYKVSFTPRLAGYLSFSFECYFASLPFYHGGIFLDNIHNQKSADLLGADTVACLARPHVLRPRFDSTQVIGETGDKSSFTYHWSDGSAADSLVITLPGTYWVKATDGCIVYQDSIRVSFSECDQTIWIPNVITPNGDKDNEVFAIRGINTENWQLSVYDRWGTRVYQSKNYRQNWSADGLAAGMYYYQLTKKGFQNKTGWVEVLR